MWTYVKSWMVQDGEVPELAAQMTLHNKALRARFWSLHPSQEPSAVRKLASPDPDGNLSAHYQVTGTVQVVQEPDTVLLWVDGFYLLAAPITHLHDDGVLEYSSDFSLPQPGSQASAICRLEVMAHYESDAEVLGFDQPLIRRDWGVQRVRVEHRKLGKVSGLARTFAPRDILRVADIDRMRRATDDTGRDYVEYIVDLTGPASATH